MEDGKASSSSVKFQLFFVPHVGGTAQEQFRNSFVRIHAEVEEGEGSSSLVQVRVLLTFLGEGGKGGVQFRVVRRQVKMEDGEASILWNCVVGGIGSADLGDLVELDGGRHRI